MISRSLITNNLLVYGSTHALIDATSVAVLFAGAEYTHMEPVNLFYLIILYNILAFALQAPFGFMTDKLRIPIGVAIAGCVLTAISAVIFRMPLLAVCFAGIGNALFHVGGGVISLNMNDGKATVPGIYVAPGALGLLVGGLIGKSGYFMPWPFIVLLILAMISIYLVKCPTINYESNVEVNNNYLELIIILLLASISIRSFIGLAVSFPWKSNLSLLYVLTFAVVFGKAFGGILADKFGWINVSVAGLILSAPLMAFGTDYPIMAIPGVFLFNMTMPVTLAAIANKFPGRAGFAFGLTTLALIFGALFTFTEFKLLFKTGWFVFATILISAFTLNKGLNLYFANKEPERSEQKLTSTIIEDL